MDSQINSGPIVYVTLIVPTITFHLTIITLIFKKNRLRRENNLFIIANITTCDLSYCFFSLIFSIRALALDYFRDDFQSEIVIFFAIMRFGTSMLCTSLLTMDRYIAVSCGLRYNQIVTKRRIVLVIIGIWMFSMLMTITWKFLEKLFNDTTGRIGAMMLIFVYIVVTIFTLSVALHTLNMRKKHAAYIQSRNIRFGIEAERRDMLQRLKKSITDVMRLNVLTVIFISLLCIFQVLKTWYDGATFKLAHRIVLLLYTCTNPFVYILTQRKLRVEVKHLVCRTGRVHPTDTIS